jgi:hypothetical protein
MNEYKEHQFNAINYIRDEGRSNITNPTRKMKPKNQFERQIQPGVGVGVGVGEQNRSEVVF